MKTMKFDENLIVRVILWDDLGNSCQSEVVRTGVSTFNTYTTKFNSSVPVRYVGDLQSCMTIHDLFISERERDGFVHAQEPEYHAWKP